ncbi:hypothetical protein FRUB_02822 [Fimbriiglobus ruber]|uniref:Uncharacterized protein n=2 Tax=Fimbriiglobus ruber TaxID=1908690 RepID=A0A225DQ32_9BACT|nr:hypothetical protein FRUB_02822 [Fimbriiglobus ruber]
MLPPRIEDTTLPGMLRRRVWHSPDVVSHALVVLTFTRLYLTPPTGTPKPETVAAVESAPDLDDLLGPLAVVVNLPAIRRVSLNLLNNTLSVEYEAPGGPSSTKASVVFATAEAADAAFTKLWRRLGDRFVLDQSRPDFWAAARTPLAVMAGILAATVAVVIGASCADDVVGTGAGSVTGSAKSSLLPAAVEVIFSWIDWRVAGGIGGAALAVAQVWLYRRLTRPPVRLELFPR